MQFEKSDRLKKLPPYLFVEIDRAKKKARDEGRDIIDLGVGDPDIPTPKFIIDALAKAAKDPATSAPTEAPQAISIAIPASNRLRITPMCDHPRAEPLPRAMPIFLAIFYLVSTSRSVCILSRADMTTKWRRFRIFTSLVPGSMSRKRRLRHLYRDFSFFSTPFPTI